jgi:hypothetical protein
MKIPLIILSVLLPFYVAPTYSLDPCNVLAPLLRLKSLSIDAKKMERERAVCYICHCTSVQSNSADVIRINH